jgi:ribosomal protein S11
MAKIIKRSPPLVKNKFVFCLHHSEPSQGLLFLRKSFTNIFLTLTDINKKVVFALSAGQCVEKNNRRGKVAPFVIEAMAARIIKVLQAFNIKFVTIIMRTSLRVHVRILVSKLIRERYQISSILDRRITAHNGVRARALKRR